MQEGTAAPTPAPVRSWLFTPATRPDRIAKAAVSGADVVIIDLEDAVAPADKDSARRTALEYLAQPAEGQCRRALRINGIDTRFGLADLQALTECNAMPDYIVVPKVESAAHLQIVDRLMTGAGRAVRLVG